jgi:hypothetical protein
MKDYISFIVFWVLVIIQTNKLNMGPRNPNLCFIAFECFYMMYLMHLNDFYEFDSNSKKHKESSRVSL